MAKAQQPLILIVEDEVQQRQIVKESLTAAHLRVAEASDGQQGLAVALEQHPSLILLDLLMPHMDGIEMLRRLRKDHWGASVPVIALTNLGEDVHSAAIQKLHVSDYLLKTSWPLADVVERVKKHLALRVHS
ncbi:MAG: response regulator [Candidatus Andersenbacteria bacterium]